MEMVHDRCSTLLIEFGTALTTILPILIQYCYKYCYSDSRNLWAVMIQPTISLEMPVPSQGHYGFHSFPVVDWFCLFIFLWVLTFPLEDRSEFGNFVIHVSHREISLNCKDRLISDQSFHIFDVCFDFCRRHGRQNNILDMTNSRIWFDLTQNNKYYEPIICYLKLFKKSIYQSFK